MGIIYAKDFLDKLKQFHDWINGNTTSSVDGSVIDYKPKIAGYDDENDVIKVSQSGSIAQIALSRQIYTSTQIRQIEVPNNVIGAIITTRIYAVAGTNPVISISTRPNGNTVLGDIYQLSTGNISSEYRVAHIWYPGATQNNASGMSSSRVIEVAGIPLTGNLNIYLDITGTFATEEGVDAEVEVSWIR